ncbi:hypothetical protein CRUP_012614 [Coryphaenoides rupestris]|nr:hypothetical protein CRUP_012614 [Coryphaenoides rupestris]
MVERADGARRGPQDHKGLTETGATPEPGARPAGRGRMVARGQAAEQDSLECLALMETLVPRVHQATLGLKATLDPPEIAGLRVSQVTLGCAGLKVGLPGEAMSHLKESKESLACLDHGAPLSYPALGAKGDQGFPGAPGIPGDTGDMGMHGSPGPPGITLPVGPGQSGSQGPPGPKGSKGEPRSPTTGYDPGHKGYKGVPGVKGQTGYEGLPGSQGRSGAPGFKGGPGSRGPLVRRVTLVCLGSRVWLGYQVLQETKGSLGLQAPWGLVFQVHEVPAASKGIKVSLAQLGILDDRDHQVTLKHAVIIKSLLAHLVQRVSAVHQADMTAFLGLLASTGLKGREVMTGTQVIPVRGERLCMDLLAPLGIPAHRGGKVHPGTTAPPGLVRRDVPATQEPRGGRDLWGRQGSLGYPEFQAQLETEASPDPLEGLGSMAHQDQKVIGENLPDRQAHPDLKDSPGRADQNLSMLSLETQESQDQRGTEDPKDGQGSMGTRGETVARVSQARMANGVLQGFQVLQGLLEFRDLPDPLASLDLDDSRATPVTSGRTEPPAPSAAMSSQSTKGRRGLRAYPEPTGLQVHLESWGFQVPPFGGIRVHPAPPDPTALRGPGASQDLPVTEALLAPEGITDPMVNEGLQVPRVNGEIKACEETGVPRVQLDTVARRGARVVVDTTVPPATRETPDSKVSVFFFSMVISPGSPGPAGEPGDTGRCGTASSGYLLVIHSQSVEVPRCPQGSPQLWVGYSLVYLKGQEKAYSQDLGKGVTHCRGTCRYSNRNDRSYWLSTTAPIPMMPFAGRDIAAHLSRCVVCEAAAPVAAFHSQERTAPACPPGWRSLWTGYSFLLHTGMGNDGGVQSLTSSGSCLKDFRTHPFMECQGGRGTCFYFATLESYWLTTVGPEEQFATPASATLKADVQQRQHTSRCHVCTRHR